MKSWLKRKGPDAENITAVKLRTLGTYYAFAYGDLVANILMKRTHHEANVSASPS